jgi:hypothetical protein
LLWLFCRWHLSNYLLRLALNLNPPDFSFSSSQDYRCEPHAPAFSRNFERYCSIVFADAVKVVRTNMESLSSSPNQSK